MTCLCGSDNDYDSCCGVYHRGEELPPTAEALMRSRYSAFVKCEIDYLEETTWPAFRKQFDVSGYRELAKASIWLGLVIHETTDGSPDDRQGTVTFTARSMVNAEPHEQKEKSLFKKKNGRWYYLKPVD